jgi:hypothetical protein
MMNLKIKEFLHNENNLFWITIAIFILIFIYTFLNYFGLWALKCRLDYSKFILWC